MKYFRQWIGTLSVLVLFFSLFAFKTNPVRASDPYIITVDSTLDLDDNAGNGVCSANDPTLGPCTLRAAIYEANILDYTPTEIRIPAGIYTLTIPPNAATGNDIHSGDLNFRGTSTNPLTIKAIGDGPVIIRSAIDDRILRINPGSIVEIIGISFMDGNVVLRKVFDEGGGAIYN